jgi:hypothetical protein
MRSTVTFCGFSLVAIMVVASAAKAQPVTLSCGPTPDNRVGRGFVHFDETEGTAGSGTADKPEDTAGKGGNVPATFSSTEIKWEYDDNRPGGYHAHVSFVLNRMTGELYSLSVIQGNRLNQPSFTNYCSAAKRQF